MDQADDRLWATSHAHDDLADATLGIEPGSGSGGACALDIAPSPRFLEIEARAEGAASAAQHDNPDRPVEIERAEIGEKIVDQPDVQRVERVRSIEGHPVDHAFLFDLERLVSHSFLFPPKEVDDAGEVHVALALRGKKRIELCSLGTERRCGTGGLRRALRELQILEHQSRGKATL